MPAWSQLPEMERWRLVGYVRNLAKPAPNELARTEKTLSAAHYVGSQNCKKCHEQIYERWRKTPMANVVRDPELHPDAIIPDLSTNTVANAKFTKAASPSSTAASGSSVTSRRSATTIIPRAHSGMLLTGFGGRTWLRRGRIGGSRFYPPDNMQRPVDQRAMDATPSITTSKQSKSLNGMSAAKSVMARAANMPRILRAQTS